MKDQCLANIIWLLGLHMFALSFSINPLKLFRSDGTNYYIPFRKFQRVISFVDETLILFSFTLRQQVLEKDVLLWKSAMLSGRSMPYGSRNWFELKPLNRLELCNIFWKWTVRCVLKGIQKRKSIMGKQSWQSRASLTSFLQPTTLSPSFTSMCECRNDLFS